MFDNKNRRRFEAILLAAVTVIASFSVNWSSLSPKAIGETATENEADSQTGDTSTASEAENTKGTTDESSDTGVEQPSQNDTTAVLDAKDSDGTAQTADASSDTEASVNESSNDTIDTSATTNTASDADTTDSSNTTASTIDSSNPINSTDTTTSNSKKYAPSPAALSPQQNIGATTMDASDTATVQNLEDIVEMRFTQSSVDYTGGVITPDYYFVNADGRVSFPDGAVTISYKDANGNTVDEIVNAGIYTVTATGNESEGYTGSVSAAFTVNKVKLTNVNVTYSISANDEIYQSTDANKRFKYTGSKIDPVVSNVNCTTTNATLTQDTDYKIKSSSQTNVKNDYSITLSGQGNYKGSFSIYYDIVGNFDFYSVQIGDNDSLDRATKDNAWKSGYSVNYSGDAQTPEITLYDLDDDPVSEDDYTVEYSNNTNASDSAKITITGKSDSEYAGQKIEAYFTINPLKIPSGGLTINTKSKPYTGSEITLSASDVEVDYYSGILHLDKRALVYGQDFDLTYSNDHTNAGDVEVTAVGKGNYTGSTDAEKFTIEPLTITDNETVSVKFTDFETESAVPSFTYTGDEIKPSIELVYTLDGNEITIDPSDYTVTYEDNVNVGDSKATVTITGKKNLTGTIKKNFSITKRSMLGLTYTVGGVTIEGAEDQGAFYTEYSTTYNGKAQEPQVSVKHGSRTLTKDKDYTVEYKNNTNAKSASEEDKAASPVAIIKGQGNYDGNEIDLYFTIAPKDISSDTVSVETKIEDELNPTFTLSDRETGTNLEENTDYEITKYDSNATDNTTPSTAGAYTAILTGKENYTGTRNVDYSMGEDLKDAVVNVYGDNTNTNNSFEYLAGNMPYVTVTLNNKTLNGPEYKDGAYVNDNSTSDYIVTFSPETLSAGTSFKVTVKANPDSKEYYGSCSKIQKEDVSVPVTKRDLSKVPAEQLSFSDTNAAADSGTGKTAKDPIIYSCDGSSTITPEIKITYSPEFTPQGLTKKLSTKSETVSAAVTRVNNIAATTIDISKAAAGQMKVTGSGNYENGVTVYYKVKAASADDITVEDVADITYDGAVHKDVHPVVKLGNMSLAEGTDYTISYPDTKGYTNVGEYEYTIKGNDTVFSGTKTAKFKIVPASLSSIGAAVSAISDQTYTGSPITLTAKKDAVTLPSGADFNVTANGNILTPNTNNVENNTPGAGDYYFTYSRDAAAAGTVSDHTNPGRVLLTIHGNGNYTGTVTGSFYITANIADENLFTVKGIPSDLTLSSNGTLTDENNDPFSLSKISITYNDKVNNTQATLPSSYYSVSVTKGGSIYTSGNKTITITGIQSNAKGSVSREVKITGDAKTADVSLLSTTSVSVSSKQSDGSYIIDYTGIQPNPTIVVTFGGKRLTENTDYTVVNNIPTEVGEGTVTVTGTGTYSGDTITVPVYVKYNLSKAKVTFDPASYEYTGSEIVPADNITVMIGSKPLTQNTDYEISYRSNTNPGTAYASVTQDVNGIRSTGSQTGTFKITPVTLTDDMVTVATTTSENYTGTYNGKEQKPEVTVERDGQNLEKDKDFTVRYSNNVNAGDATVTISGKGGYTGKVTRTFTIGQKDIQELSDSDIVIEKAHFAGEGVAVEPAITVKDGSRTLKKGTDYTYASRDFKNNSKVGDAEVTLHGTGNYTGTKTAEFEIEPLDLSSDSQITLDKAEAEYTGNEITPTVQVSVDDGTNNPVLDSKYYVVNVEGGKSIKDAGRYTCNISASENYSDSITGKKSFTFTVNPKELNFLDDTWNNTTTDTDDEVIDSFLLYYQDENGAWQKFDKTTYPSFSYAYAKGKDVPAICLIDTSNDNGNRTSISDGNISANGVKLISGTDFTVRFSNNGLAASAKDKGNAPTITISGTGNYTGSITRNYSIGKDITDGISVKLNKKTFYYNGKEQKPTVTYVKNNGTILKEGTDYTVSIPSSFKAGSYNVTIKGTGEYYGTYEVAYTIKGKKLSSKQIGVEFADSEIKEQDGEYYYYFNEDTEKFEPKVEVYNNSDKSNSIKLTEGMDYTVSYGDSTHDNFTAGTKGIVHITLIGDYSGSAEKTFAIKKIDISDFALSFTGPDIEGDDDDGYTAEYSGSPITSDFYIEGSAPEDDTIYNIDTSDSDVSSKISVSYTDNTYPGEATLTINGIGNYTGTITKTFTITGNIEEADVSIGKAVYTGAEVDPPVTVTFHGKTLTEGTDYTLTYAPDSDNASGTVTVTGKGYYSGRLSADYTLTPSGDIFTMSLPNSKYPYTGQAIKQVPTITNSATGAVVTNATISYSNSSDGSACIMPGTVTVTATIPVMNTSVELTGTYSIVQASIYDCTITGIDSYYNYTGNAIKPLTKNNISVTLDGMTIPSNCYEIQYPDRGYVLPGTYTVSVVGRGVFGGYRDFHYQIRVPKVENLSATAVSKDSASLAWDGVGVATGYRITYAKDGKRIVKKTKDNTIILTGLPESSNITVNVSAYLKDGTKTYYSVVTPVSVGTKLTTPAISAIQAGSAKNTLSWNQIQSSGGYMIYRCTTKNGNYYPLASVPANRSYFTDTRAKSGRTYYYKISTYRIAADGTKYDESEKSAPFAVKTR